MNNANYSNENNMFSTRTIVNFPLLTTESLTELIDTLGFKMGLPELRFCQNSYRNGKLNNPTINELKIIDRVFYDNYTRPEATLISSFMTNGKTTADTYADLMARRKAVTPDYTEPCSVAEMLDILPKYLGKGQTGEITLFAGKQRNADISACGFKKIAETGTGSANCAAAVRLKSSDTSANLSNGNIAYAILASFNRIPNFKERLDAFLSTPEMMKQAKHTAVVDNKSVITVLASLGRGIKLDTLHFERKDGAISPFEPLAEADTGIITFFDKPESVDMLLTAQLFGLRVIPLGYLVATQSIDGISQIGEHLSLNIPFLRSLAFSRAAGCEADGKECNISNHESSAYINVNRDRYKLNSVMCGGKNYYMAGFNTALYAYSLCLATGIDDIQAAGVYSLPSDLHNEKTLGCVTELILGAYRAECEFEICDSTHKIEEGETPSFSLHTMTKTLTDAPSKFSGMNTKIYYLEPRYTESGLPDFDDIKKMHKYIRNLIVRGSVISIRPTTDNMNKSISAMSELIKPTTVVSKLPEAHYGGFIIETNENIEGLLIATTQTNDYYSSSFNG